MPPTTTEDSTSTPLTTNNPYIRAPLVPPWTKLTQCIHNGLTTAVTFCAATAAHRPWQTILSLTFLSIALLTTGYASGGFILELDIIAIFTPSNCKAERHSEWIQTEYNETRLVLLFFHNDGNNVLHTAQTRRVVEAVDVMHKTPGLEELCGRGSYVDFEDQHACRIWSVSGYWTNHSLQEFDASVESDEDVRRRVAGNEFANGSPIFHDALLGNWEKEAYGMDDNNATEYRMTSAQSYFVRLDLPDLGEEADIVEEAMILRIDALRRQWLEDDADKARDDPTRLSMDVRSVFAYQMETRNLIFQDLYLVGLAAMVVIVFTCLVFYRHDSEKAASRTLLGIASILTITMSLMAGCGVMFLCGVPYTLCTQMLPYVIYGIGLDDTFIITGAFFQLRDGAPVEQRIQRTMKLVGWSICLTTITTITAFVLGYVSSSFPGVQWLCLYATVIIVIDFFFQITYFVAWLVLDERRIQANKRDGLCCCFTNKKNTSSSSEEASEEIVFVHSDSQSDVDKEDGDNKQYQASDTEDTPTRSVLTKLDQASDTEDTPTRSVLTKLEGEEQSHKSVQERVMIWYSDFLLRPPVKICVLVLFAALFGCCAYSATLLEQHFVLNDYVPDDSYLKTAYSNIEDYSSIVRGMQVYFRDVDQTNPEVQQQMRNYIDDLEGLEQIGTSNVSLANMSETGELRPFCWVRDFQEWEQSEYGDDPVIMAALGRMSFLEKLEFALHDRTVREVYGNDIIRDPVTGNITASRCTLFLRDLDLKSVPDQVGMLMDEQEVTGAQPINEDRNDWAFFSFDVLFFFWESSAVVIDEMIFTTIAGVVAVSFVAFVFVPHWTATLFVVPLICILYIDLLGTVRFFGLYINPLTYICVVVSIGLLVDFLIHILLRYYEATPGKSRDGRVKETLETMGVSILVGGLTTLLAAVPLAFSSAEVFKTVFYSFFAIVSLGVTHGLILLPVLLSYFGPTVSVIGHPVASDSGSPADEKCNDIPTPKTQASISIFSGADEEDIASDNGSPADEKCNDIPTPQTQASISIFSAADEEAIEAISSDNESQSTADEKCNDIPTPQTQASTSIVSAADEEESVTFGEKASSQKSPPPKKELTYQEEQRKAAASWRSMIEEFGTSIFSAADEEDNDE